MGDHVLTPPLLTTLVTAHIHFLYNSFIWIHVHPEDGFFWKAETCSYTLGGNVNTPLQSNKQVVLNYKISCTLIENLINAVYQLKGTIE